MIDIGNIMTSGINIAGLIILVLFSISIAVIGWFAYSNWKKYQQYKIVVWHFDGFGQLTYEYDNAGIFVNRRNHAKRLWLKKGRVGLSADNIPFINSRKGKIVHILKIGGKNYRYLKPSFNEKDFTFRVGEEDTNWAILEYQADKSLFFSDRLLQILPYMALGIVSVIILIMFMWFFKNFGVLKDVAINLKEVSKNLILANGGNSTVIIRP